MTTLREAAQQALEALEHHGGNLPWNAFVEVRKDLRTALAQQAEPCPNCASLEAQNTELDRKLTELERAEPVQEPVAWMLTDADNQRVKFLEWQKETRNYSGAWIKTPLYTAPPKRQPLSGLEVERLLEQVIGSLPAARNLVRAVERAHGIIESEIRWDKA